MSIPAPQVLASLCYKDRLLRRQKVTWGGNAPLLAVGNPHLEVPSHFLSLGPSWKADPGAGSCWKTSVLHRDLEEEPLPSLVRGPPQKTCLLIYGIEAWVLLRAPSIQLFVYMFT